MGTLSINGLHGSFKQQWTEIKSQTQTIVKNNYSQQQFILISIPLTASTNLKPYFSREIFLLPKTPKVIVLQKQKDKIFVLVQHPQIGIVETLKTKNCQLTILLFLRDISNAVYALKKKYQPFLITQKMIKMCKNQNILVWFNQKYESNLVQLPLQKSLLNHQQIMIQSIINIFLRYSRCKARILIQKFDNFLQFKQKIQSQINLQQQCNQKTTQPRNVTISAKKDLFCSQKQISNRISYDWKRGNRNSSGKKQRYTYLSNQKEGKRLLKLNSSKQLKTKSIDSLLKIKNNLFSSEQESSKQQIQKEKRICLKSVEKKFKLNVKKISQKQQKIIKFNRLSRAQQNTQINKKIGQNLCTRQNLHIPTSTFENRNRFSSQSNTQKQQIDFQVQVFKGCSNSFKKKKEQSQIQSHGQFESSQSTQFLKISKGSKTSQFTSVGSFSKKNNNSLKSTAGTVRKTKQFQQHLKFTYIQEQQIIKEQSDQTHKNSMSISQDLDKLFPTSGRGSIQVDEESEERQQEFEKLFFN